ncbi:MAG: protein kinase, partial [Planctomycetes bacterium]|nr:protein kinase [Planctomycetota bacterium]
MSEWSELGGVDKIPTSLIVHEYRLRHMYGDQPDHSQYETRFASHGRTLTVSLSQVDDELHDARSLSTEKSSTLPGSQAEMTLLPDSPDSPDSPGTFNQPFSSDSGSQQSPPSGQSEETIPMTEGYKSKSHPNTKRFGNYELLGEIARGAMGVVFKARQLNPKRIVAVKMILTGQLAGEEEIRRFHAEAENAGCLKHANIVTIYESGELEGQHYFSMDYIEGQSLADLIQEKPLKMEEAARFARIIAEAIQYAHTQGVLHRDMKPSNVLIDAEGQPHVTDFGIAKQVQNESHMTASGAAMGTPSYMPPEQAKGDLEALGPTCDVYSLGALLYHLVTGRPPFLARSPMETMMQVLHNEPASPRVLNPEVDRDLETICLKCLEKEPHRRYASAQDLADDLARYQRHEPIVARPISTPARLRKWCRRNPGVAFFSATTFLSLVAISVGATYGFVIQKELKDDAVVLKDQAVNAQRDAEMRKKEVETLNSSLKSTIQEKENALKAEEDARKEADTQKEIAVGKTAEANRQKIEAEKQKKIAEKQKQLAERRQQEAVEERKKAEQSEAVAKTAKIKAQANLGKANQAVQEMLAEVAQEELKNIPHMTPVRKRLLNKAIVFYEDLLKDNDPDDVTLQKDKAKLEYLIGTIHQMSGEYPDAEQAFRGSIEIAARLADSSQGTSPLLRLRLQLIQLKSERELADVYIYKGELEKAQV